MNYENRRLYERIDTNIECLIILKEQKLKYHARINDISENGMGITVYDATDGIKNDENRIGITFTHNGQKHEVYADIVREIVKEDSDLIGCLVDGSEDYENFVRQLKNEHKAKARFIL